MRISTLLYVCLFTVLTTASVLAQGGSNYSTIGLGDMRNSFGATYDGLAGVSYGTPSDYAINLVNPAMWTDVKSTRLQSGYRFNQLFISQNGATAGNNNGKLDGALVMFALDTTAGVNACIGIVPSSSINYAFTKKSSIQLPDSGGIINSTSLYAGSGGMISGLLGAACKINDRISVGATALFHFGVIQDSILTTIVSDGSNEALTVQRDLLSSIGFKFGVQTRPADNWTLGAALTFNGTMSVSSDLSYRTLGSTYDSTRSFNTESSLPLTVGLGASYLSGKFLFVADAEYQSSSSVSYRKTDLGAWTNGSRVGIGVSRVGGRSAGTAYWDRVNFNMGLGHQALTYTFRDKQISENFLSLGAQLPFGGAAMIDLALTLGNRDTGLSNAVSETFVRFNVNISVGEVWFIPFKREF